jgi:alpha-tubulin suppressor-like RCC1 family protein
MKCRLLAFSILTVVVSMVLSPVGAWGAEAPHVYSWGAAVSTSYKPSLQYFGPAPVDGIPGTVVRISPSNSTSYALTKNGQVWAWGSGQHGALGNGSALPFTSTAVQVKFPTGIKIASLPVPMPYDTGIAIDTSGNVWGWGFNSEGPLCMTKTNLLYPEQLPLTHVTMASGAGWHALYLSEQSLYSCGGNAGGELGDGTTTASESPMRVVGLPDTTIRSIVSSWENSGVVMADGSVYDWGFNGAEQLGDGVTTNSDVPVHIGLPAKVVQLSMGGSDTTNGQTIALLANGSTWAWGSDRFGQLGTGRVTVGSPPVKVAVPAGTSFVQVRSGGSSMYAIDRSGAVWSWGQNEFGELGFGNSRTLTEVPTRVDVNLSCVFATAANVEGLRASDAGSTTAGAGHSSQSQLQCGL